MSGLSVSKIVVPIDFSEESFAAIDTALEIADSSKGVHVLHVLAEIHAAEPGVVWHEVDDQVRTKHASQAVAERLTDPKYSGVQVEIAVGDPGHEIGEFAESIDADLIVIPSHGRTGLTRLLIGSVAERVIRLAHCPVLVLRS